MLLGIGIVPEINCTDVSGPASISIYPVGIVSIPASLTSGAPLTCSSIRYCGLRPDISDVNRTASASRVICVYDPGNITTGSCVALLIILTALLKSEVNINEVPTRITSTPHSSASSDSWRYFLSSIRSGSISRKKQPPLLSRVASNESKTLFISCPHFFLDKLLHCLKNIFGICTVVNSTLGK